MNPRTPGTISQNLQRNEEKSPHEARSEEDRTWRGAGMNKVRILIAGGGFGGAYVFKRLHRIFHKNPRISLELVSRTNYLLFTPLLHEVATGSINPEHVVEPLRKILGCCLNTFYLSEIENIDLDARLVRTAGGDAIDYDYLVLALGSETNFYSTPGAEEHAFTLKTLGDAVRLKNHLIEVMEASSHKDNDNTAPINFVVVGGGPTGVELAAEMSEFLKDTFAAHYAPWLLKRIRIVLIQKAPELIPQFPSRLRSKAFEALRRKHIDIRLNTNVLAVEERGVRVNDGSFIPAAATVWVAGVKPATSNITGERLTLLKDGRFLAKTTFQLAGYKEVLALGDIAAVPDNNRYLPALAQVATKEAAVAAQNIKRVLDGKPLLSFHYRHAGDLVSLGQWMAIGEIAGIPFWGHMAWWFWRTIYLSKMLSLQKKIKVAVNWTLNLFSPRDISKL